MLGAIRSLTHFVPSILLVAIASVGIIRPVVGQSHHDADSMKARWIWSPEHTPGDVPQDPCYFRKLLHLPGSQRGVVRIAADDVYELYVNGKEAGKGSSFRKMKEHDISDLLRDGKNVIAIKVDNRNGQTGGVAAEVAVESADGEGRLYLTNPTWRTSLHVLPLWNTTSYRDGRWKAARNLGTFGDYQPWDEKKLPSQVTAEVKPSPETLTRSDKSPRADSAGGSSAATDRTIEPPLAGQNQEYPEFSVQPGFQIQHVAGHKETGSVLAMAFNEFGQILVSQEGGPLLLIHDSNNNGVPDQVQVCCHQVESCQGILPVSGKVYVVGNGSLGMALYELEDKDHDGILETVTALLKFRGELGEHGPHGLALGPDGMLYIAFGNHTQLNQPFAMTSPYLNKYEGDLVTPRYEDPRGQSTGRKAPGGGVMRVDLQGKKVELFAGGQRNAYDLAFHVSGDLFMHDSDMESDLGTPWHRSTRLMHVTAGGEFGWRSGWSKWPDYLLDSLPPVMETGRGSPTGCVFYQHTSFPVKYRNAFFSCDWSQGEINVFRFDHRGAGYAAHRELFLRGKPLNVTDIAVGPDGWLYFCTGGRGTQGNIFRVVHSESVAKRAGQARVDETVDETVDQQVDTKAAEKGILRALRQPGLNTAWGRQAISKLRQDMGTKWDFEIREYVGTKTNSAIDRANAMQIMHLLGPPPSDVELIDLSLDKHARVRAKAAYLMGLIGNDLTSLRLVEMLRDDTALVRRRACEALARTGQQVAFSNLQPLLTSPDRFEATAARRLLEKNETEDWLTKVLQSENPRVFVQGTAAAMISNPSRKRALRIILRFRQLSTDFVSDVDFVDMLRVVELAIERGGLRPRDVHEFADQLAREFPAGNTQINRELAKLLVFVQASDAIDRMLDYLDSDVAAEEKIHVAMHLRFLEQGWSSEQRLRHLRFMEKASGLKGQTNLSQYIDAAAQDIAVAMSPAHRALILENGADMPRMAVAVLFALPESSDRENFERLRRLDYHIAERKGAEFDRLKIGLVAIMARGGHDLHMSYLREAYDRSPERRQSIAMGLAQKPDGHNWDYLVRALPLLEGGAAREVLVKLRQVPFAPEETEHFRQVILCGLRLKEEGGLDAAKLLFHWVGRQPDAMGESWKSQLSSWQRWFDTQHPGLPIAALPIESGNNTWTYQDLDAFLSSAEGRGGSAVNGRKVYRKAQCAKCHVHGSSGENYGPDLTTIHRRFQVREILESIVYPSQVISDQYRSKSIITNDGHQYAGLVVPVGNGNVKLVQNDGETRILQKDEIDEILPNNTSSMPEGLLNPLTLQEVADLFAFLSQATDEGLARDTPDTVHR